LFAHVHQPQNWRRVILKSEVFMLRKFQFLILAGALIAFMLIKPLRGAPVSQHLTITLWPHGAPGETGNLGPEHDATKPNDGLVAGKWIIRLTNVSNPTITIYNPSKNKNTGSAVVVFPGGGYRILAMDLEGTEVCRWLNSIGITCVLLKYRVPSRPGARPYTAPLQDAQRAVGLVRYHAKGWHIDPHRIGVLGFSAGGNLAAVLSNNFERRTYQPVDDADQTSCRPDFALLIYPAYLVIKKQQGYTLAPELKVTASTPPTFLVQTEDDPIGVENSLYYYLALTQMKVPAEMHLYAKGGHGYGLRPTSAAVTIWPRLAERWLRGLGVLRTTGEGD
jgi:acetyl esterase/lipase